MSLTEDEIEFYGTLGINDSVVKVLGDDTLLPKLISGELRVNSVEQT